MNISEFTISTHAVDRLFIRSNSFRKLCLGTRHIALRKKLAYEFVLTAVEDKILINNKNFMWSLGIRHGTSRRYSFFRINEVILVGVTDEDGTKNIVTVLSIESCHVPTYFYKELRYNQ